MSLTQDQVFTVARRVTEILKGYTIPHYFVGSVASALWGADRTPNDIDLVVAQPPLGFTFSSEGMKGMLVSADRRFSKRSSTNPGNDYTVLWFALAPGVECKVDVLVPPALNVPFIAADGIMWSDGLPVAPLLVHVLLKVQAWAHHRTSPRADFKAKEPVDVADIGALLAIAKRVGFPGFDRAKEKWGAWLSKFTVHVRNFVWVHPEYRGAWQDVGWDYNVIVYKDGVAYEP